MELRHSRRHPGLEFAPFTLERRSDRWPKGTGFYLESVWWPNQSRYHAAALRVAQQVCPHEQTIFVKAVAREALKRVLGLHFIEDHRRALLVGYQPTEHAAESRHVSMVMRELAWEREKWSAQLSAWRWRRYNNDPEFMRWLQRVPADVLVRWARSYVPEQPERMEVTRSSIAALTPMPAEIRKAYFIFSTEWTQLQRLAGAEVYLTPDVEYPVCLVSQRLVALHSTLQARHGPQHIEHLAKSIERHVVLRSEPRSIAADIRDWAHKGGKFSQGRLTKKEADVALEVVDAALERAQAILTGTREITPELERLTPTHLVVDDPCPTCTKRTIVTSDEGALPPFHRTCRCFRLSWRSTKIGELERRTTLWALECAVHDRRARFPLEEFIEAGERLRGQEAYQPLLPLDETTAQMNERNAWRASEVGQRRAARSSRRQPPGLPFERLVSTSIAGMRLGMTPHGIRQLCDEGKLGAIVRTESGHRRISLSAIEAYIAARTENP